ncbi:MAG: hypothetical protein OXC62_17085 [Aestuariivita sp.]|nr:hypothetical protein [Aestuariivita sp.]
MAEGAFSAHIPTTGRLNPECDASECQHRSDPAHITADFSLSDVDVR